MNEKKYYVGLDMGTNSVGWAVTDVDYNLLRARGKDMWGIREFDEASTAKERRMNRVARRRTQRAKVRIGLLKGYFDEEINKVDPDFFIRMDNSFFLEQDKNERVKYKNILFNDPDYSDKNYYKEYPTVFHLIKELIYNPEPHDIRLVYLAVLNIFKHRGHFLNDGLSIDNSSVDVMDAYRNMRNVFCDLTSDKEVEGQIFLIDNPDTKQFEEIMLDRYKSRSAKRDEILLLLGINKKSKSAIELVKAMCGLKADASKIFSLDSLGKVEFTFSGAQFEEKVGELEEKLGEDCFSALLLIKQVYDACSWNSIINGYDYLCDSRVALYEQHHEDLKMLKELIKKHCTKEIYLSLFRSDSEGSYGDYSGSNNTKAEKTRRIGTHKQETFYKKIKDILKNIPECEEKEKILKKIENESFMPKQLTGSNGIIPYQAHSKELRAVLKNAAEYLPFLNEKTNDCNLSVMDQIIQLFEFKIPYYVGPTFNSGNGNGWAIRKEKGKVLPWNIDQRIDMAKTSEEFISRLVRRCTYISDERVLPKASLIYEKYMVLNLLNTVSVDGERISVEIKQDMYHELFEKGKKITVKKIQDYLSGRGVFDENSKLSGFDVETKQFPHTLTNYAKFVALFGEEKMKTDKYKELAENIVFWCTVYGDSKRFLKQQLENKYKDLLDEVQIKRILGYKFKDWGRLSKEFLFLCGCDCRTGEIMTLLDALWGTQYNMMELIHSEQFTFAEELEKKAKQNYKLLNDISVDDLDGMYLSAPVKRMVWQTILILREIEQVMGHQPERVFVEMTRNDGEKGKRKESRKQKFLDLYKNIKDESMNWKELIERCDSDGRIRSKKMYLYLLQQGKDMYTGKPIPLEDLFDDNLYDIDHLYPQSLVKDDNLDNNMVLVNKAANNTRGNAYPIPIPAERKTICHMLWKALYEKNFINEEKYKRLTGTHPFTDEQLEGFIARQIVETGQGTKAIAEILKEALPDTKIIYSKAKVVSDFRNKFDIPKCRSINDFHHANDAYLNIVVGNSYYSKFTDNPKNFIKKQKSVSTDSTPEKRREYNLAKFFEYDVEGAWIGCGKQNKNGSYAEKGTIVTVKKNLAKNTPILSRMPITGHGAFADATRSGAGVAKDEGYIRLKGSDERMNVDKYGGFKKPSTAYFFLVEHEEKGKKVRTLETVPLYRMNEFEAGHQKLERYCEEELHLINPSIRMSKIKLQSLVKWNGFYLHIMGKTGNRFSVRNATNMYLENRWTAYVKKIDNLEEKGYLDEVITKEDNQALFNEIKKKHEKGIFTKRPNALGDKLKSWEEYFKLLSVMEQVNVLKQLISMTAIAPDGSGDMTLLKGKGQTGIMRMSKKVTGCNEFKLIKQSITGLYEQVIDLQTV